jgi:hypothetical protein
MLLLRCVVYCNIVHGICVLCVGHINQSTVYYKICSQHLGSATPTPKILCLLMDWLVITDSEV